MFELIKFVNINKQSKQIIFNLIKFVNRIIFDLAKLSKYIYIQFNKIFNKNILILVNFINKMTEAK